MVPIEVKMIPENRANRRAYARGSAYYQKFRIMDFITLHDVGSYMEDRNRTADWYWWYIAVDPSTENPARKRKAWHYTSDPWKIIQTLRNDEVGLHAGDGLFGNVLNGNSNSIGIEMLRSRDPQKQKMIEANTAWLCAKLIREKQVRKPFPECMKQHWDWVRSDGKRKDCPWALRNRPRGWDEFLEMINLGLNPVIEPVPPIVLPDVMPELIRPMPLRVDGVPAQQHGYLGRLDGRVRTYVEIGYIAGLSDNVTVKGEGDHLAINTGKGSMPNIRRAEHEIQ